MMISFLKLLAISLLALQNAAMPPTNQDASPKLPPIPTATSGETADTTQSTNEQLMEAVVALKAIAENRPIDGVTAMTLLLIGSFLVDRISSGLLGLLSLNASWNRSFPNPLTLPSDQTQQRTMARTKQVVVYYLLAIAAAGLLLYLFQNIHLWKALGFTGLTNGEDRILTMIVIVVGAERVAQWLQLPGTPGAQSANAPVEITGELTVIDRAKVATSGESNPQ